MAVFGIHSVISQLFTKTFNTFANTEIEYIPIIIKARALDVYEHLWIKTQTYIYLKLYSLQ